MTTIGQPERTTQNRLIALFRDELGAPNALYLDGAVSKVYAPALERNETGLDMGPIVGVVRATGRS